MYRVDLNSDLGESFGNYKIGADDKIIPLITSANVACGYHDLCGIQDSLRIRLYDRKSDRTGARPRICNPQDEIRIS